MGTLLAKNADVVVTMDEQRREMRNAGLFARDDMPSRTNSARSRPGIMRRTRGCSVHFSCV